MPACHVRDGCALSQPSWVVLAVVASSHVRIRTLPCAHSTFVHVNTRPQGNLTRVAECTIPRLAQCLDRHLPLITRFPPFQGLCQGTPTSAPLPFALGPEKPRSHATKMALPHF